MAMFASGGPRPRPESVMSQILQSDPGQRDRVLGRLLLQALQRRTASHGPVDVSTCPDTELLSAYVDRALDAEETARCELHFTDCVRCRSTLAAFMEHCDVPQVVPAVRQPASIGPRSVIPADVPVRQTILAKHTIQVPPRVRAERRVLARQKAATALPKARWILRWIAPALSLGIGAAIGYALHSGPRVGTGRVPARIKAEIAAELPSESASPGNDAYASPSLPASTVGTFETSPGDSEGAPFFGVGSSRIFQTGGGSGAATSSAGISNALTQAGERFSSRSTGQVSSSRPVVFASPDGKTFWRIDISGRIEHSTDQGRDWQVQPTGVSAGLVTGVAVSDQVAWIVGRGGILLRTTDGKQWQRVATPGSSRAETPAAVAHGAEAATLPQWIQVDASDALHATITSSDSQQFATANGGLSWNPVAPADHPPAR
jgi:hypothetical protein